MKTIPDHTGMREVTREEWVDHVSDFRTYQTESIYGQVSIMYSKLSPYGGYAKPGHVIAEAHYVNGAPLAYFIR